MQAYVYKKEIWENGYGAYICQVNTNTAPKEL